jgi:hypothetical protein
MCFEILKRFLNGDSIYKNKGCLVKEVKKG